MHVPTDQYPQLFYPLMADPLADIANLEAIVAVVANGRYFDRAQLDTLIAGVERQGRGCPEAPTP